MKNEMQFVNMVGTGGVEVLKIERTTLPQRKEGEVLIDVFAAGLNGADMAQRKGAYPPPPGASPILGLEVAGTVREADANSQWKSGDRVCALVEGGGYAEVCLAAEGQCLPVPEHMTFEQAAGVPEAFFTVWANVFQIGALKSGETFLVHGGASGIGTTAIQLARAFGAKVLTTAGSEEKCKICQELGAAQAINYKEKDFSNEFKDVNLILDMVGGSYTVKNISCLAMQGRLVQIATRQGKEVNIDLFKIMQKRITLTGSTLRPRSREDKALIAKELREWVWPLLASGKIKPVIDSVFPMSEVAKAHERMESSAHTGKIILKIR